MKEGRRKDKFKSFIEKNGLIITIVLLMVAPIIINVGLVFTDYVFGKTGVSLTAIGLDNENWLEFWKQYLSTAIAFLGIYLVWNSSNKDRKRQCDKDLAEQYLQNLEQEEKVLVEVSQCFNTGIIYKSLLALGNMSVQDSKLILQDSRDKVDEAHVKFELLTELSDDFQKCEFCKDNPCKDKLIMKEIRDIFYDMEKHYINMLNLGEEYCNKVTDGQRTLEMINIHTQLVGNIKQQISFLQNGNYMSDGIFNLQKQLSEEEQQLKKLNEAKLSNDMLQAMVEPIHKEIHCIAETMRPKFNRYCKIYIDMKKNHAKELRISGMINHVKDSTAEKQMDTYNSVG